MVGSRLYGCEHCTALPAGAGSIAHRCTRPGRVLRPSALGLRRHVRSGLDSGPGGLLHWTAEAPDRELLRARDVHVLEWEAWRADAQAWLRPDDPERATLEPPAAGPLRELRSRRAVAVLGVRLTTLAEVRDLYDGLLVPLVRAGVPLLVECKTAPEELDAAPFVEPGFEHAFTVERLQWLGGESRQRDTRHIQAAQQRDSGDTAGLDESQRHAVRAGGGVVQVIAPAGSGKTTVLIERVRELLARGAAPERILCLTFNTAAAAELKQRLSGAGVLTVEARTFNSIGNRIIRPLVKGRELRPESPTVAQWGRWARIAGDQLGVEAPEAAELPERIAAIKLGELATPDEYSARADLGDDERCLGAIYRLFEAEKAAQHVYDFDDQIFLAVRHLRSDARSRRNWQHRFDHVLVDEYQDIEPAQELLVRMLAAPQDDLFAVGDEDQTLYGWRRASVRRIVDLDAAYPSLERHALEHNYRCTPEVVAASSRLIARNRLRFPKTIKPTPGRPAGGRHAIRVAPFPERDDGEAERMLAKKLSRHARGEIVVLARTVNALRPYALEAAAAGLRLAGPEELFESSGAIETLQAYFAVFTDPSHAREQHVRIILRRPTRGSLGPDAAQRICAGVHRGLELPAAVEALPTPADARWRVTRAAEKLAALASITDAAAFIGRLRQDGLDHHFEQAQRGLRTSGPRRLAGASGGRGRGQGPERAALRGAARRTPAAPPRRTRRDARARAHDRPPSQGTPMAARRRSCAPTRTRSRTRTRSTPARLSARLAKGSKPSGESPTWRSRAPNPSCRSSTPPDATAASCTRRASSPSPPEPRPASRSGAPPASGTTSPRRRSMRPNPRLSRSAHASISSAHSSSACTTCSARSPIAPSRSTWRHWLSPPDASGA